MHSYNSAFYELKNDLQPLYDEREAVAITHELLNDITGLSKAERLLKKETYFTEDQQKRYDRAKADLAKGRPLQYVTGSAWFMGREFVVNESVLIPRPETEELVQWVVENSKFKIKNSKSRDTGHETQRMRVLDVGAGSGCIGLSLASLLANAVVTCVDISKEAIELIKKNIEWVLTASEKKKGADNITLKTLDFLNETQRNKQLGRYELIVSNPPYIPASEKVNMHKNVKDYEPAIALFVPDNDALVFYGAIAAFGKAHLSDNGYIYCELDSGHAEACKTLFEEHGYTDVEIKKDMHGNWRMLRCGVKDTLVSS